MIRAILYLLVVFSTNVIQGITGFAGTVLAMPFTILLYGIDVAKPSLTILTTLACLFITARNFRHIAWREFFKIILLMFAGVLAGEAIYPRKSHSFWKSWRRATTVSGAPGLWTAVP